MQTASSQSVLHTIKPFQGVGALKFGMLPSEVLATLGDFEREVRTFRGVAEVRKNIFCLYKRGKLCELTFSPGIKLLLDDRLLLRQDGIENCLILTSIAQMTLDSLCFQL